MYMCVSVCWVCLCVCMLEQSVVLSWCEFVLDEELRLEPDVSVCVCVCVCMCVLVCVYV